jgi:hypothetical protein
MRVCSGHVARRGRMAYVGQRPFIQNRFRSIRRLLSALNCSLFSTLRDNVTFGQAYDEDRYRDVIRQCALEQDLKV